MRVALIDVDGHNFPNLPLMKLSAWHKSQGKAQYTQIGEVVKDAYERHKDSAELVDRITNAVSVYVLTQSVGYMDYLRSESEVVAND